MYLHFEVSDSSDGDLELKSVYCTMPRTFLGFLDSIVNEKKYKSRLLCDVLGRKNQSMTSPVSLTSMPPRDPNFGQISIYASENSP